MAANFPFRLDVEKQAVCIDGDIETALKYGGYCRTISYNILHNDEDSEECVNDTYLKVWSLLPPRRPKFLSAFIGKITRNLALDRWRYWYVSTVQEIASDYGWSESKVKMMLMRTRNDLRKKLEQEGIML